MGVRGNQQVPVVRLGLQVDLREPAAAGQRGAVAAVPSDRPVLGVRRQRAEPVDVHPESSDDADGAAGQRPGPDPHVLCEIRGGAGHDNAVEVPEGIPGDPLVGGSAEPELRPAEPEAGDGRGQDDSTGARTVGSEELTLSSRSPPRRPGGSSASPRKLGSATVRASSGCAVAASAPAPRPTIAVRSPGPSGVTEMTGWSWSVTLPIAWPRAASDRANAAGSRSAMATRQELWATAGRVMPTWWRPADGRCALGCQHGGGRRGGGAAGAGAGDATAAVAVRAVHSARPRGIRRRRPRPQRTPAPSSRPRRLGHRRPCRRCQQRPARPADRPRPTLRWPGTPRRVGEVDGRPVRADPDLGPPQQARLIHPQPQRRRVGGDRFVDVSPACRMVGSRTR